MGLEVIRTVMQRQGVTSDMLSAMSGVPKSTIDKIASGATDNPRYKSLQKLMDALGMTMDDFIRLVDNKERSTDEDILISVFHSMNPDGRARALQLLAAQGLITVRDGAGLTATVNDITENPHNLQIKEIEAAQLPRTVQDVDFAVINGNYALQAGLHAADALAIEDASGDAAQTYANIIACRAGEENSARIQALVKALQSDAVKEYIEKTYNGAVVAIF